MDTRWYAKGLLGCVLVGSCLLLWGNLEQADARSAASPRRTGTELPGGPRPLNEIPGATIQQRNMDGTQGRLDAYGRPIMREAPPEKIERKRLPAGAYGGYGRTQETPELPDVTPETPAWKF